MLGLTLCTAYSTTELIFFILWWIWIEWLRDVIEYSSGGRERSLGMKRKRMQQYGPAWPIFAVIVAKSLSRPDSKRWQQRYLKHLVISYATDSLLKDSDERITERKYLLNGQKMLTTVKSLGF